MKIFSEAELIEVQNAVISLAQELQVTIDCWEAEKLKDKVLMLIESYRHVKEALESNRLELLAASYKMENLK